MAKKRTINELRQTKDAYYVHKEKSTEEQMNPSKYTENDLEQAKCSIAEKITKHFNDILFEEVCEEHPDVPFLSHQTI